MYSVITFREPALVLADLDGRLQPDELRSFFRDLDRRLIRSEGPPPPLLLDTARFEPQGDISPIEIDRYIERCLEAGIRVGRVMGNQIVAHQRDRVAGEVGFGHRLRHFGHREPALDWLRGRSS